MPPAGASDSGSRGGQFRCLMPCFPAATPRFARILLGVCSSPAGERRVPAIRDVTVQHFITLHKP